ncbi:type II toxin-antitoxin system Phd/YefM family antitoxin [Methylolobus aquaticus]
MSQISPTEDIRSVTDLKRHTREILDHLHATGRPVILTVNGRANSVLLDVRAYVELLRAGNMAELLTPAERNIESGNTRPIREFMGEFKGGKNVPG